MCVCAVMTRDLSCSSSPHDPKEEEAVANKEMTFMVYELPSTSMILPIYKYEPGVCFLVKILHLKLRYLTFYAPVRR